jgi:hypothetical protein
MTDLKRCTNCRGMKKVAKLGGMIGDCNLCSGTGKIADIPAVKVQPLQTLPDSDLLEAVAECVPVGINDVVKEVKAPEVSASGTRKIYKRKTG